MPTPVFLEIHECETCTRKVRRYDGKVKKFPVTKIVKAFSQKDGMKCPKCKKKMMFRGRALGHRHAE